MTETRNYIIKQISVFSENRPGRLAAIAHALEEEKINILAFSIAEATGLELCVRLLTIPKKAYDKLTSIGSMLHLPM